MTKPKTPVGKLKPGPPWHYFVGQEDLEEDTIAILWSKKSRQGKQYMSGVMQTDAGELRIIGLPFVTRRFQTGLAILLDRDFSKKGVSVRSDGDVRKENGTD